MGSPHAAAHLPFRWIGRGVMEAAVWGVEKVRPAAVEEGVMWRRGGAGIGAAGWNMRRPAPSTAKPDLRSPSFPLSPCLVKTMFTWHNALYYAYAVRVRGWVGGQVAFLPCSRTPAHLLPLVPAVSTPDLLARISSLQRPMANLIRAALTTGWWALMLTTGGWVRQFQGAGHLDFCADRSTLCPLPCTCLLCLQISD